MIDRLSEFAKEKTYALLRKKGAACPKCGEALDLPAELATDQLACSACAWRGSWTEAMSARHPARVPEEKPKGCQITEKEVSGGREWLLPAKKRINFFLFFGLFFGGLPLLMIVLVLTGVEMEGNLGTLGAVLFLFLFVAVGGAVFYWGLRVGFTEYFLRVADGEAVLVRKFFGRKKLESIAQGDLAGVGLYESHQENDKSVYGLMLRSQRGNHLKFGSHLKRDEVRWLGGRILQVLPDEALNHEEEEERAVVEEEWQDGPPPVSQFRGVAMERRGEGFRVEISGGRSAFGMAIGGFFTLVFGAVFAWIGFQEAGFPFNAVGVLVIFISLAFFARLFWTLGTSRVLEFNPDGVIVRKFRYGREGASERVSRLGVTGVKLTVSGSSNDQKRYAVSLQGEKEVKVFSWIEAEIARSFERRVEWWLADGKLPARVEKKEVEESGFGAYGAPASVREMSGAASEKRQSVSRHILPVYKDRGDLTKTKNGRLVARLLMGVFIAVGAICLLIGFFQIKEARASVGWMETEGLILESRVESHHDSDGTTYGAEVRYSYRVKDAEFEGSRISYGDYSSSNHGRAKEIVARYPVGAEVVVYVDPADIKKAVLEPGMSGGVWLLPGIGGAFFLFGILAFISMERQMKKGGKKLA
ncbi:MAG: DUF3592 domain-containing protein [Verrucomicrobiales bacterium]